MAQVLRPVQADHALVQAGGITHTPIKCFCFGPRPQTCQHGASKGIHRRFQTSLCTLEVQWVHKPVHILHVSVHIWSDWPCSRRQSERKNLNTVSLLLTVVSVSNRYCLLSSSCNNCWFGGFHSIWGKALKIVSETNLSAFTNHTYCRFSKWLELVWGPAGMDVRCQRDCQWPRSECMWACTAVKH